MTLPDLIGIVRSAPAEELPAILGALEGARVAAQVRLQAPPAAAPVVRDLDETDYTPDEVAEILQLRDKAGNISRSRVYNLARRAEDPLPTVSYGRRAVRIPRRLFRDWKRRQPGGQS